MKKSTKIILNVCILFLVILSALILAFIIRDLSRYAKFFSQEREHLDYLISHPGVANDATIELTKKSVNAMQSYITRLSIYTVLGFLAIGACSFIFVYCNPKLFRRSTWTNLSEEWAQNKAERLAAKQAKAEADKQKEIAELEKKLDELKKD